jgi:hypothetical protein
VHRWLLVPVLLGLGLSGCSATTADPSGQSAAPTSSAAGDASERPEQTPASGSPSASARSASPRSGSSTGEALGTRTSQLGTGQVRADVLTLRRSGDLLTLEIQLTNLDDGSLTSSSSFTASVQDNNVTGITLVDGRNKKRYLPAKDSAGTCLCSKAYVSLDKGGSTILSAGYAGPPADVDTLSVELPGFGTFADLPVSG